MQTPVRELPSGRNEHTAPKSSDKFDALLQFEPEQRSAPRSESRRASTLAPVSVAPPRVRHAVAPPPRALDHPSAARSKDRGHVWLFGVAATVGAALLVWIALKVSVASQTPLQVPFVPPPPPAMVRLTAPVVIPANDTAAANPAVAEAPKKPAARASVPSPLRVVEAPIAPQAASRPLAPAPRFHGSLVIDSVPSNARAFINGEAVGITPLVLTELPVGSRAIRIEADDHVAWSSTVRVVAGEQTRVSATLSPSR